MVRKPDDMSHLRLGFFLANGLLLGWALVIPTTNRRVSRRC
jgi:hypothetical protein